VEVQNTSKNLLLKLFLILDEHDVASLVVEALLLWLSFGEAGKGGASAAQACRMPENKQDAGEQDCSSPFQQESTWKRERTGGLGGWANRAGKQHDSQSQQAPEGLHLHIDNSYGREG